MTKDFNVPLEAARCRPSDSAQQWSRTGGDALTSTKAPGQVGGKGGGAIRGGSLLVVPTGSDTPTNTKAASFVEGEAVTEAVP